MYFINIIKKDMKKILYSVLFFLGTSFVFLPVEAETKFVTIGTGGTTGVYYRVGLNICRLVNKGTADHSVKCTAESTGGSIYNLNTIRAGELDMGVAQSDWQFHAYNGTSKFADKGANKKLRAVFSVHSEPFTVVARKDADIKTFYDLRGKRVNIGNPGSGQRGTMEVVMAEYKWKNSTFSAVSELKADEQGKALCDNRVDAIVYTVGHPNANIKEATTICDTVLVRVDGNPIKRLVKERPYYRWASIPGGMYQGNDKTVKTFGVGATFVTSADVGEELVYTVVKTVFENFDAFRKYHPAFANLKQKQMIQDGLSAPLHSGAVKYYKEIGLLK